MTTKKTILTDGILGKTLKVLALITDRLGNEDEETLKKLGPYLVQEVNKLSPSDKAMVLHSSMMFVKALARCVKNRKEVAPFIAQEIIHGASDYFTKMCERNCEKYSECKDVGNIEEKLIRALDFPEFEDDEIEEVKAEKAFAMMDDKSLNN